MTRQQEIRYWVKYKRYLSKLIKQIDKRINKIEKGLSRSDKLDILIQPRASEVAFVLRKRANLRVIQ